MTKIFIKKNNVVNTYTLDIIVLCVTLAILVFLNYSILQWKDNQIDSVSKNVVILTNFWAIFPIIVANGIWIKSLLIASMLTSFWAHMQWSGVLIPGKEPGKWDNVFATTVIVAYAFTWWPDRWSIFLPEDKHCLFFTGRSNKTTTFNCKLSTKLLLNIVISTITAIFIYIYYDESPTIIKINHMKMTLQDVIPLFAIIAAIGFGLIYICDDEKHIGNKNKPYFIVFFILGTASGIYGYMSKRMNTKYENVLHSQWHVLMFTSAYCFSRASSYIQIEINQSLNQTRKKRKMYNNYHLNY